MRLKDFINALDQSDREAFAGRVGSSIKHLQNVMYGFRPCATDLAVSIERESKRAVTRPELRDDWRDHWPELARKLDRKPRTASPSQREAKERA